MYLNFQFIQNNVLNVISSISRQLIGIFEVIPEHAIQVNRNTLHVEVIKVYKFTSW